MSSTPGSRALGPRALAAGLAACTPLLLVACRGDDVDLPATGPGDAPTYYRDVAPVLDRTCVRCHDGRGLGPGDFSDPETAAYTASAMAMQIRSGNMPPPAADPACHPYEGHERFVLDPADQETILAWADAGSPLGDPETATSTPWTPDHLEDPEIRTEISTPYVPEWKDGNEYRCFILDLDTSEDVWIAGIEPIIDVAAISHHTVLFADPSGTADQYVEDQASRSWWCPDVVPDPSWVTVHAWAPGNNPVRFPPDTAARLPRGSQVVLQMHYYRSSDLVDGVADQPGYLLDVVPPPASEMYFFPLGPENFTIPAGARSHTEEQSYPMAEMLYGYDLTTRIHGVFPHMHTLGDAYSFRVLRGDGGRDCIARADRYDFSNQPTYWFEEPVEVGIEDTLSISCTWDASGSEVDVGFGENTQQEMCYALMYVTIEL